MTIKETLLDSVSLDGYLISKGKERERYLTRFKEIGIDILNYLLGTNFLPGLSVNDVNQIIKKMGATLEEMGNNNLLPIYPTRENWREGTLTMNSLVAKIYGLKNGDTAQLIVEDRRGVQRNVIIDNSKIYGDGELFGVGLYLPDFQYLTNSTNLNEAVRTKYILKRVRPRAIVAPVRPII